MHFIVIILFGIAGIIVGTNLNLWIQGALFVAIIMYFNSRQFASLEIGALVPYALLSVFIIGMVIGDISYMFQTDVISDLNLSNPFVVGE